MSVADIQRTQNKLYWRIVNECRIHREWTQEELHSLTTTTTREWKTARIALFAIVLIEVGLSSVLIGSRFEQERFTSTLGLVLYAAYGTWTMINLAYAVSILIEFAMMAVSPSSEEVSRGYMPLKQFYFFALIW